MLDEVNFEEKGIFLESMFHNFLIDYAYHLPKCSIDMIPHSGKRRYDPSFDVVMQFDYNYWFDVVATYKTRDHYGYRLKTENKDFRSKIKEAYSASFHGENDWYGGGLPFLAFQLLTDKGWRWYCIELHEKLYFIDYTSDLRVNKKLIKHCIPLEDKWSSVVLRYRSLPLFKDRELFFNQELKYDPAKIVLSSPKKRGRKKGSTKKKEVEPLTKSEEYALREWLEERDDLEMRRERLKRYRRRRKYPPPRYY